MKRDLGTELPGWTLGLVLLLACAAAIVGILSVVAGGALDLMKAALILAAPPGLFGLVGFVGIAWAIVDENKEREGNR